MSLNTFLTDLGAARTRFVGIIRGKGVPIPNDATIIDCLNALDSYWEEAPSNPSSGGGSSSGGNQSDPSPSGTPTKRLVLTAPTDLYLYYGGETNSNPALHYWSDEDVLTLKVLNGQTVLTTSCTGYNGMEFETNSLTHLCAGERVLCDVGSKPSGVNSAELTIQWLRGETVVKTETRTFDWTHVPQYFTRPAGEGNYSLKIGGSTVAAEVLVPAGSWIDFPGGVLSSSYAGRPVRTKSATSLDAIACWSNEGADGDNFWYLP